MGGPRCYGEAELVSVLPAPVGGAKLLEEETESKVKRLVSVYIEALKNLLVSWQFLFQGSFSSLVLASFKFQELFTYITLFMSCFFPL